MIYVMTPSVAQTAQCQVVGWLVNKEFEMNRRNRSYLNLRQALVVQDICLAALKNAMKALKTCGVMARIQSGTTIIQVGRVTD
jgi:hypothetical protein